MTLISVGFSLTAVSFHWKTETTKNKLKNNDDF